MVHTTPARAAALRARMREAATLRHANLAHLVAVGTEDGAVAIAREWLAGSLARTISTPGDACRAMIDVLDAIELAHWHDLTHGDIRKEKFLVRDDGAVVLVDLGLEGQGTVQRDLRGVADALEDLGGALPEPMAQVVAATHQGAYPTARDLQRALQRALRSGGDGGGTALWARVRLRQ